jgi:hypothetical protein
MIGYPGRINGNLSHDNSRRPYRVLYCLVLCFYLSCVGGPFKPGSNSKYVPATGLSAREHVFMQMLLSGQTRLGRQASRLHAALSEVIYDDLGQRLIPSQVFRSVHTWLDELFSGQ